MPRNLSLSDVINRFLSYERRGPPRYVIDIEARPTVWWDYTTSSRYDALLDAVVCTTPPTLPHMEETVSEFWTYFDAKPGESYFTVDVFMNGELMLEVPKVNGRPPINEFKWKEAKDLTEKVKKWNYECKQSGCPFTYRIRRAVDVDLSKRDLPWQKRELQRFTDGTYTEVPWANEKWYVNSKYYHLHFAHISTVDPGKVAYTQHVADGVADRQMRVKTSKYLKNWFGDILDNAEIRKWSATVSKLTGEYTVKMAGDSDTIERVYIGGPNSCMSHEADDYDSDFHPVRVYGAGDIQIAWIEREGDVVSRCLVWPEKKRYNRIYGDGGEFDAQLADYLQSEGYEDYGDFSGARLLLHRSEFDTEYNFKATCFVCPYLDRNARVIPQGNYLVISAEETPFKTQEQNGYTTSAVDCGEQGGWCRAESAIDFYGKPASYDWLTNNSNVFVCRDCGEYFWLTDQHHDKVCKTCYKDHDWTECSSCHSHFLPGQMHNGECLDCLRTTYRLDDPHNRPEPPYPDNWCRAMSQGDCGSHMKTHIWYRYRKHLGDHQIFVGGSWRDTYCNGRGFEFRKAK